MPFDGKVGDTAFILDDGGGHTYVVLTNPNKDGYIVRVNFTSAKDRVSDGKVFTRSDDRDLFSGPTVVLYNRAEIYSYDKLRNEANNKNVVNRYKQCPQSIMEQIIKDAFGSQFTKGDVIEELRAYYPTEYKRYYGYANQE